MPVYVFLHIHLYIITWTTIQREKIPDRKFASAFSVTNSISLDELLNLYDFQFFHPQNVSTFLTKFQGLL